MGQRRPQKKRPVKVPKLENVASDTQKDKQRSTMLTEKETAALFLGDLASGTTPIPFEYQRDQKPSASPATAQTIPTRDGKLKKRKTPATAKGPATTLNGVDMMVPLEEGEDDPSVAAEVLRQTAVFLARLTPSRSQTFWALRQVARGEKSQRSIAKYTENPSDDDEEEEEELTSSDDLDDEKTRSGTTTEEEDVESGMKNAKDNKMKRKRGDGGSLFNTNPDVWDD